MRKDQKGFVSPMMIIVVIALVVVGYLVFAKHIQIPRFHQPSITSDWRTYSNAKYGFEIKYDPLLEFKINKDDDGVLTVGAYGPGDYSFELHNNLGESSQILGFGDENNSCFSKTESQSINSISWTLGNYDCGQGGPDDFRVAGHTMYKGRTIVILSTQTVNDITLILSTFKFTK